MSEQDTQQTAEAEARAAEVRENVALTDARRAEEEVARAQEEQEEAAKREEKLSRKERRLREKAERVHAEADRMRERADQVAAEQRAAGPTISGATVASPGVGTTTEPDAQAAAAFPGAERLPEAAQRPEVLIGATFAGAFVAARILKRLFD